MALGWFLLGGGGGGQGGLPAATASFEGLSCCKLVWLPFIALCASGGICVMESLESTLGVDRDTPVRNLLVTGISLTLRHSKVAGETKWYCTVD